MFLPINFVVVVITENFFVFGVSFVHNLLFDLVLLTNLKIYNLLCHFTVVKDICVILFISCPILLITYVCIIWPVSYICVCICKVYIYICVCICKVHICI